MADNSSRSLNHTLESDVNPIDRLNNIRKNEEEINKLRHSDNALFLACHQIKLLVTTQQPDPNHSLDTVEESIPVTKQSRYHISWKSFAEIVASIDKRSNENTPKLTAEDKSKLLEGAILLGTLLNRPVFTIDLSKFAAELFEPDSAYIELRNILHRITRTDFAILGQARSLVDWHARHGFCPQCGHNTRPAEGGTKRICTNTACNARHFPRTDSAMIVAVGNKDNTKLLLGRQKIWPKGMYSTLAGYMEPGESIEESVRREVFEEAGIRVGTVRYHSSQPWPYPSQLMIGCIAVANTEDIQVDQKELEDARWFTVSEIHRALEIADSNPVFAASEELRVPPPYAIANRLIRQWATEALKTNPQ